MVEHLMHFVQIYDEKFQVELEESSFYGRQIEINAG